MTLRTRLTLVAAAAVAVAVIGASVAIYVLVRGELRQQIDESLQRMASTVHVEFAPGQQPVRIELPAPELGGAEAVVELVDGPFPGPGAPPKLLPVNERDLEIDAGQAGPAYRDAYVGGVHVRILTAPVPGVGAVQVARSLEEVDDMLRRLLIVLAVVSATGAGAAALLGRAVARATLTPVRRMTEAAEHVSETGDLTRRIDVSAQDELGRLAATFNSMLEALDASLGVQRQLVADASHELRTPLTSLRTNIEVLASGKRLRAEERRRLLADVVTQTEELTALVADVVELARGAEPRTSMEDVRLDQVVAAAVERARIHAPGVEFRTELRPSVVRGDPARLERAVANLLDNAVKWNPPGAPVEVSVEDGAVTVRDHGPGIDAADLPHVFDRFYRARAARGMPGSGLGLAIVRQVAESHGGSASAENAEDGGARLRLELSASS